MLRDLIPIFIYLSIMGLIVIAGPKLRLHPASAGITTNTWSGEIRYQATDWVPYPGAEPISGVITCVFSGADSFPYREGGFDHRDGTPLDTRSDLGRDIQIAVDRLCESLPMWLFSEGFPPRELEAGVVSHSLLERIW